MINRRAHEPPYTWRRLSRIPNLSEAPRCPHTLHADARTWSANSDFVERRPMNPITSFIVAVLGLAGIAVGVTLLSRTIALV